MPYEFVQIAAIMVGAVGLVVTGRVITHWLDVHYKSVRGGGSQGEAERIERLDDRVASLEAIADRVSELEERIEFAERLLASQREADRLGRGD